MHPSDDPDLPQDHAPPFVPTRQGDNPPSAPLPAAERLPDAPPTPLPNSTDAPPTLRARRQKSKSPPSPIDPPVQETPVLPVASTSVPTADGSPTLASRGRHTQRAHFPASITLVFTASVASIILIIAVSLGIIQIQAQQEAQRASHATATTRAQNYATYLVFAATYTAIAATATDGEMTQTVLRHHYAVAAPGSCDLTPDVWLDSPSNNATVTCPGDRLQMMFPPNGKGTTGDSVTSYYEMKFLGVPGTVLTSDLDLSIQVNISGDGATSFESNTCIDINFTGDDSTLPSTFNKQISFNVCYNPTGLDELISEAVCCPTPGTPQDITGAHTFVQGRKTSFTITMSAHKGQFTLATTNSKALVFDDSHFQTTPTGNIFIAIDENSLIASATVSLQNFDIQIT